MARWKITYTYKDYQVSEKYYSNKEIAIERYLLLQKRFDINELKIFKNNKEYIHNRGKEI